MNSSFASLVRVVTVLAVVSVPAFAADKNEKKGGLPNASRLPEMTQAKDAKPVAIGESLAPQHKIKFLEAQGVKIDTSQLERPFTFSPAAPRISQGGLGFFNPVSYSTANKAGTEKGVVEMHTNARPGMGSILSIDLKAHAGYRYIVDVWVKTQSGRGEFDLMTGGTKSVISAADGHITLVVGPFNTQTEVGISLEGREGTGAGNWEFHRCEVTPVKAQAR